MKILIKPIITEKATNDSEMNSRYTFLVSNGSNKLEIKDAVESNYGVKVQKVRTLNYGPVRKTKYTKTGIQRGKTKIIKKAIVKVSEGDTIDFYSNI